jgi:hypothetical protein
MSPPRPVACHCYRHVEDGGTADARNIESRYSTRGKEATMDTGDMQQRLHRYLGGLGTAGSVTKEDILGALAERDDALRTMITEYIPEGTYPDLWHAITLIPEEAWQAVQGDVWRGGNIGEETESGFADSPVAKDESKAGSRGQTPSGGSQIVGMPGDGAGRIEDTQSQHTGVWPASGPLPDNPDARYQDMHSFGQGARGAAGYEDSGRSEVQTMPPEDGRRTSEKSG